MPMRTVVSVPGALVGPDLAQVMLCTSRLRPVPWIAQGDLLEPYTVPPVRRAHVQMSTDDDLRAVAGVPVFCRAGAAPGNETRNREETDQISAQRPVVDEYCAGG